MPATVLYAADLVAIGLLIFGIYFPRHRRRDLTVAYLGVNVGVLAVAAALATSTVGAGLGLGLFGVLSIIRLRSAELDQTEVAYYFSALALGLLGGLGHAIGTELTLVLMALIITVMYTAGHPRLLRHYRHQMMLLDRAFTEETSLTQHLEQLLNARIHRVNIHRVDLVNDTSLVDVRFSVPKKRPQPTTDATDHDDNHLVGVHP
jgi:hypothetical protein